MFTKDKQKEVTQNLEEMKEMVESAVVGVLERTLNDTRSMLAGVKSAHALQEEIEQLKITKGRIQEEQEKKVREVEHKVGLERKRQEFEQDEARRTAVLEVREENLTKDRERFEEQMKFHDERFSDEVGYLKNIVEQVLERLPTANVEIAVNGHSKATEDDD